MVVRGAEQEKQDGSCLFPYRERFSETERENRDAVQSRIAMLEPRTSKIGITISSSGSRLKKTGHKMDGAFIEVSKARFHVQDVA